MFLRVAAGMMGLLGVLLGSTWAQADEASTQGLSVMTYNMWHKDRPSELKAVAQRLKSENARLPDFIVCQEVVFNRRGEEKDTAAVLAKEFGYHSQGTKRRGDREGIAIISKYPFVHYDALHLKAQTSKLLLGFNRVSVMGEFMVPGVGRVRVVDVHLTNWGFEHRIREKQLKETLQWIAQREAAVPAAVTFLGGDFNAKRHWKEMKLMDQSWGGLKFADHNSTTPSMGLPGEPDKRIDHIFVATKLGMGLVREKLFWKEGVTSGSSRFYPSDHLLVMHEYTVSAPVAAKTPPAKAPGDQGAVADQ